MNIIEINNLLALVSNSFINVFSSNFNYKQHAHHRSVFLEIISSRTILLICYRHVQVFTVQAQAKSKVRKFFKPFIWQSWSSRHYVNTIVLNSQRFPTIIFNSGIFIDLNYPISDLIKAYLLNILSRSIQRQQRGIYAFSLPFFGVKARLVGVYFPFISDLHLCAFTIPFKICSSCGLIFSNLVPMPFIFFNRKVCCWRRIYTFLTAQSQQQGKNDIFHHEQKILLSPDFQYQLQNQNNYFRIQTLQSYSLKRKLSNFWSIDYLFCLCYIKMFESRLQIFFIIPKIKIAIFRKYFNNIRRNMSEQAVENHVPENVVPQENGQNIDKSEKHESQKRQAQGSERNDNDGSDVNNERVQQPNLNSKQNQEEQIGNQSESQVEDSQKTNKQQQQQKGQNGGQEKTTVSSRTCFNKLCNSKKTFRKVRSKVVPGKYRFLCKNCYDNYLSNNYCEFCEQLYSNNENESQDFNNWVGCDNCERWNHIQCEKRHRNKDISENGETNSNYYCMGCTLKLKGQPQPSLQHNTVTQGQGNQYKYRYRAEKQYNTEKRSKAKVTYTPDQKFPIFFKKPESYINLQGLLQNNNFRLAINDNLIKDDLESLRAAAARSQDSQGKPRKKVKAE